MVLVGGKGKVNLMKVGRSGHGRALRGAKHDATHNRVMLEPASGPCSRSHKNYNNNNDDDQEKNPKQEKWKAIKMVTMCDAGGSCDVRLRHVRKFADITLIQKFQFAQNITSEKWLEEQHTASFSP